MQLIYCNFLLSFYPHSDSLWERDYTVCYKKKMLEKECICSLPLKESLWDKRRWHDELQICLLDLCPTIQWSLSWEPLSYACFTCQEEFFSTCCGDTLSGMLCVWVQGFWGEERKNSSLAHALNSLWCLGLQTHKLLEATGHPPPENVSNVFRLSLELRSLVECMCVCVCVLKVAEPQTARSESTTVWGKNQGKISCSQQTQPGESFADGAGLMWEHRCARTHARTAQVTHLSCCFGVLDLGRSWLWKDSKGWLVVAIFFFFTSDTYL